MLTHEYHCLSVYPLANPKSRCIEFFWRSKRDRGTSLIEGGLQVEAESDARIQLGGECLRGGVRYGIRHAYRRIDMAQYLISLLIRVAGVENDEPNVFGGGADYRR